MRALLLTLGLVIALAGCGTGERRVLKAPSTVHVLECEDHRQLTPELAVVGGLPNFSATQRHYRVRNLTSAGTQWLDYQTCAYKWTGELQITERSESKITTTEWTKHDFFINGTQILRVDPPITYLQP